MTAGEAGKLMNATDFPFTSAKQVAYSIVERADYRSRNSLYFFWQDTLYGNSSHKKGVL